MRVIELSGRPWELGEQQAVQLGPEIQTVTQFLNSDICPHRFGADLEGFGNLPVVQAVTRRLPEAIRTEAVALAQTSQVPFIAPVAITIKDDVGMLAGSQGLFCSSVVFPNGSWLRTLDYYGFMGQLMAQNQRVFRVGGRGRLRYLSVSWPLYLGVLTGLNEAGFGVAIHACPPHRTDPDGLPSGILARRLLEQCGSRAEAVRLIQALPPMAVYNFLLTDQSGGTTVSLAPGWAEVATQQTDRPHITVNHPFGHLHRQALWRWLHRQPGAGRLTRRPFVYLSFLREWLLVRQASRTEPTLDGMTQLIQQPNVSWPFRDRLAVTVSAVIFDASRPGGLYVFQHHQVPVSRGIRHYIPLTP